MSQGSARRLYGLSPVSWAIYRSTWLVLRCVDQLVLRTRARGLDGLDDGPLLLLSNHVSLLDPFCVGLQLWRPCRFMAATSVCDLPVVGRYLRALGAFPKMKFVKDRESMRILTDYYEAGLVVTLFPEGVQTWTGEPLPIAPGIGRLIKRLNARVLFARNTSGYLVLPRWAKYPRCLPLEIDYVGPVSYDASLSVEEITEDVARRLTVAPQRDRSRLAFGFRLAEGLPQLLWACPSCFALDALEVVGWRRRDLSCAGCGARWRLDIDAVLHGQGDGDGKGDGEGRAPTLSVAEAHRAIEGHFGAPPVLSPERRAEGVVGHHPLARVRHMPQGGRPEVVAEGPLEVCEDHLSVGPPGQGWRRDYSEVLSVSVDIGGQLFLRCAAEAPQGALYRLEVPGQSALKWGSLLQAWVKQGR